MAHYSTMLKLQRELRDHGIDVIVPEDERHLSELTLSDVDYSRMKRRMSEKYFRAIRRRNVYGILVANCAKHGRDNYIGPNTLAEIAIAINARKKVFLLGDIYPELKDELTAWGALPLRGDVSALIQTVKEAITESRQQLRLEFPTMK